MKRKPDIMWILVIIFGLGVVTTGYTQSLWERPGTDGATSAYEAQSMLAPHTKSDQ